MAKPDPQRQSGNFLLGTCIPAGEEFRRPPQTDSQLQRGYTQLQQSPPGSAPGSLNSPLAPSASTVPTRLLPTPERRMQGHPVLFPVGSTSFNSSSVSGNSLPSAAFGRSALSGQRDQFVNAISPAQQPPGAASEIHETVASDMVSSVRVQLDLHGGGLSSGIEKRKLPSSEKFILAHPKLDYQLEGRRGLASALSPDMPDHQPGDRETGLTQALSPEMPGQAKSQTLLPPTTGDESGAAPRQNGALTASAATGMSFESSNSGSNFKNSSSWGSGSTAGHARQVFAEDNADFLEEQLQIARLKEGGTSRPEDMALHRISEGSTPAQSALSLPAGQGSALSLQSLQAHNRALGRSGLVEEHGRSEQDWLSNFFWGPTRSNSL